MGRETVIFRSKEAQSRSEASALLRQMADRLESGQVLLRQGREETRLEIPGRVVVELKVEDEQKRRKGVQHSLEIELKWFDGDDGPQGLELG